jgi:hypothetical protein
MRQRGAATTTEVEMRTHELRLGPFSIKVKNLYQTLAIHPPKVVLANPPIPLKIHTLWIRETVPENAWTVCQFSDRIASILFGLIVFIQKLPRS